MPDTFRAWRRTGLDEELDRALRDAHPDFTQQPVKSEWGTRLLDLRKRKAQGLKPGD
jgi:hypothetical protein